MLATAAIQSQAPLAVSATVTTLNITMNWTTVYTAAITTGKM